MTSYPEDSVLHRHMQSALQFSDVAMPDIPTDSVLHRHAADMAPSSNSIVSDTVVTEASVTAEPVTSKEPSKSSVQESPRPVVTQAEQPGGGGLFAWIKRLLGG